MKDSRIFSGDYKVAAIAVVLGRDNLVSTIYFVRLHLTEITPEQQRSEPAILELTMSTSSISRCTNLSKKPRSYIA